MPSTTASVPAQANEVLTHTTPGALRRGGLVGRRSLGRSGVALAMVWQGLGTDSEPRGLLVPQSCRWSA